MAKQSDTAQSKELNDPSNPPDAFFRPDSRRSGRRSLVTLVVVAAAIVSVALVFYVSNRRHSTPEEPERQAVGTVGLKPGGFEPRPEFSGPRDEIAFRGAGDKTNDSAANDLSALTSIDRVLASDRSRTHKVSLTSVEVERVDGNDVWLKDGGKQIVATVPGGTATPRPGDRVNVTGSTERSGDSVRIHADAIRAVQ